MAEEKVEVRETAASAAVTVVIDGRRLEVPAGFTILEACREAGSEVPTLCYHPALSPGGHCRLCVVEVADNRNLVPACCTPVSAGLQILTSSQRVREARRGLLRLLLAEHPQDCLTCEKSGECLLQKYAYEYGVGGGGSKASASPAVVPRAFAAGSGQPLPSSEARNPFFLRDTRKCILCGRCVKVCGELQGRHAIALMGRGRQTWVGTPFARPLADPPCTFCGNCVQFCPTGALVPNFRLGRGRSWELQRTETVCEYCGVGCRIRLLTREGRIVGAEGAEGPPNYGLLCVKGRFGHGYLQHPERLKTPLVRRHGELVPASWAEALAAVASGLKRIRERWGPDALAGLASARCTNEENYLFQKLFRAVLGTNNVDHCARLCHAPTLTGLQKAFGSGAMTNSLADLALSRCYLVVGSNTPEAHPGVALQLQRGRRRGARLLVVDPRRTDLAEGADLHLRPRPGTDVALFHALAHVIVTERLYDAEFIRRRTEGFAALARAVRRCPPEWAEAVTGVPAGVIREAARIYATSSPAAILYAMGVTQYAAGTDRVLALANLALLTGNVGRPGSGVNPLRGQNNVQGACDMGALPDYLPGYAPVGAEEERRRFAEAWGRPLPARPGLALSELAEAMAAGKVRGLYIMGENPLVTEANLGKLEEGLARLELLVVQDLFLTETARRAHVVLPAAALPEKEGTVTSTERRVQLVRPALPPPGEARPDLWILAQLFAHLGGEEVA
ncbi:MAG: molybdopterin-dependent oxidoreductase, partial [Bacillota bacterium]|nr:molybdopterin-dependent oxidoreductase [Bacillota bacterium]